jgi:hypothetical protein
MIKTPSGLAILVGFVVVLACVVWLARLRHQTIPDGVGFTLICFSFVWTYLAMLKIHRGCRRLGWDRSHYTQLLLGPRPDDPDLLHIWRWTFHLCFAILAVLFCVLAFTFTA